MKTCLKILLSAVLYFALLCAGKAVYAEEANQKMNVAVVEFEVKGDLGIKDAGAIIAEWMISALDKTRQFNLKERVLMKKILEEQAFEASGLVDDKTLAAKAGKLYGIEGLVTGSVLKWGNKITVTARLIDTKTGAILRTAAQETSDPDTIPKKIDKIALVVSGMHIYKTATGTIPAINGKVASLRFFEGGFDPPHQDRRKYKYKFKKRTSKYIHWELNLKNIDVDERKDFTIIHVWNYSNGNISITPKTAYVNPGWTTSRHTHGRGYADPGKWAVGKTRVDLFVDGNKITSEIFEIYE